MSHIYKAISQTEGLLYAWFSAMHTRADLILYGKQSMEELLSVVEVLRVEIQRWETIGNCFDDTSELSVAMQQATVAPVTVSDELYELLTFCKEVYRQTFGYFDVTVHSEDHDLLTIDEVLLSEEGHTLFLQCPGIRINLSGILKGWTLDRLRTLLKVHGVENALISLGNSSVLALGCAPMNVNGWKVDFTRHKEDVILYNECLTTSGNDMENRKHIISPHSGKLIEGRAQVGVVTKSGAAGEVLSTSLFAATASDVCEKITQSITSSAIYWQT